MRIILTLCLIFICSSCSYLKNAAVQAEYRRIQETDPSMMNLKHMIDHDSYFVYGKLNYISHQYQYQNLAVAAFSNRFKKYELVDVMESVDRGAYFGLDLPPGMYQLLVISDMNQDGYYNSDEVVGQRSLMLTAESKEPLVKGDVSIDIGSRRSLDWPVNIRADVISQLSRSFFFPAGTIRQLDDPLFDQKMATMGMYQPAEFLKRAGTMFYALEEDYGHKIPVVFVHGINGSARNFEHILEDLDRSYYKPWFFHYPSGGDLDQMADFFYQIFLSGKVVPDYERIPLVIVAHSMGGIVVREALNKLNREQKRSIHFMSLASPFGGHPAAAIGEKRASMVLPSWKDLNPDNKFITRLFREPLPERVTHQLLYAYDNPKLIKGRENSDGVVPLHSQLRLEAQQQSEKQMGFKATHAGILHDKDVVSYLLGSIHKIKSNYSEDHLAYILQGGFDVPINEGYTDIEAFYLSNYAKYLRALVLGKIEPYDKEQVVFVEGLKGKVKSHSHAVKAWRKFIVDYPHWQQL